MALRHHGRRPPGARPWRRQAAHGAVRRADLELARGRRAPGTDLLRHRREQLAARAPQHRRPDRHPAEGRDRSLEPSGHRKRHLQRRLRPQPEADPTQLREGDRLPRCGLRGLPDPGEALRRTRGPAGRPEVGTVWALDPDTGKVLWRRDIGTGAPNGGIHWGIAFDRDTVYVPVAQIGRPLPGGQPIDPALQPGLYAVDARTGEIRWQYSAKPDCAGERGKKAPRCERLYGFSGAPTVIDGVVIQGGLDGRLYAIDAADGRALWTYDTLRDFEAINGVKTRGGSIDSASIVAANGLLFVGSGYGMFGQAPGNALLAFRPAR
ncbi:PQQ-binding-like beta-propeller repeat protein [Phenylobacterium sp.]|uniref:outer membrane protein assembly factor BamB family protein n=1 Tax=Phenylobacterium sp. TaxID=1871053 RepID=UPI002F959087